MQSSSFKNSTIAWRRTPSHPYHPILIENMIRRSSTPDVLQTSLSIYQFKSALSRKSAPPPCLHIVPASLSTLYGNHICINKSIVHQHYFYTIQGASMAQSSGQVPFTLEIGGPILAWDLCERVCQHSAKSPQLLQREIL